jgi:hypothetical protein
LEYVFAENYLYTCGFLQPINVDGTSMFKYYSTTPVKIQLAGCTGVVPANLPDAAGFGWDMA